MNIGEMIGKRAVMMVSVCGLALGVGATAASGQDLENREERMNQEPGHYELDEEEWYDPTDWFDGDSVANWRYEDGWDWEVDDNAEDGERVPMVRRDGETYDGRWWSDTDKDLFTESYYDGYYDGYEDDEFGYDDYEIGQNTMTEDNGYAAGYYDGYYDARQGYESDWTYYIVTVPMNERGEASDRQRRADESRQRGDRSKMAGTDKMSEGERMEWASEDAMRIRGRIDRVVRVDESNLPEHREEHVVQRISFDNGKTVLADLGRRADRVLLERGDKVTLYGKKMKLEGEMEVLDVSRLSVNGERMWNASENSRPVKSKLK